MSGVDNRKACILPGQEIYDARTGQWCEVTTAGELLVQGVDSTDEFGNTAHKAGEPALLRGQDRSVAGSSVPFIKGHGQAVRVTTKSGLVSEVYAGHLYVACDTVNLPFAHRYELVKPEWRQAGDLKKGDRIAILNTLDCLEPVPQDPREVELVGYWIGDGSMPTKDMTNWGFSIDASPLADDLRKRYISLVESFEGVTANCYIQASGAMRITTKGKKLRTVSCVYPELNHSASPVLRRGLCGLHYLRELNAGRIDNWTKGAGDARDYQLIDVVKKWGLYGSRAWDKKIPKAFYSLPNDQLAIFLSALWDTDGSVFQKNGRPSFEYSSVSEELARGIQRLLYRFGVVSRLTSAVKTYTYKGQKKQGRVSWRLAVNAGVYVERLAKVLTLHGEREKRRLAILDREWGRVHQTPAGDVYWDTVKTVESIGDSEYWDINVPGQGTYVSGTGPLLSSNSGKDLVARCASMRIAYLLICLRSPQDYFGWPPEDSIHLLNVASSALQANRAFFKPMMAMASKGWFADHCEPKVNSIEYDKNIEAISGHSDAESQEGLNLVLGILDEPDAFRSREFAKSAGVVSPTKTVEGIYEMLFTSASSRFPETFKVVQISYPRHVGSYIQRVRTTAERNIARKGDKSPHYASGPLCTWDVNPQFDKYERITVEGATEPIPNAPAIVAAYEDDAVLARAKYECKPARAINPYFGNTLAVEACFADRPVAVDVIGYRLEGGVWVPEYRFDPSFKPIVGARYAMHGDLAITGDRAGIAMAHVVNYAEHLTTVEGERGDEVEFTERRPNVKVDFVLSYSADAGLAPPREIQIRWAKFLAIELVKRGFNVRRMTYDGYASAESIQWLITKGIESEKVSTDRTDVVWKTLKDVMYEGRLTATWRDRVINELLALDRIAGGKVDHPGGTGSKDEADALACAVYGALALGGEETGIEDHYSPGVIMVGPAVGELPYGLNQSMLNWTDPATTGFESAFNPGIVTHW